MWSRREPAVCRKRLHSDPERRPPPAAPATTTPTPAPKPAASPLSLCPPPSSPPPPCSSFSSSPSISPPNVILRRRTLAPKDLCTPPVPFSRKPISRPLCEKWGLSPYIDNHQSIISILINILSALVHLIRRLSSVFLC